jgi:hypothetical protein
MSVRRRLSTVVLITLDLSEWIEYSYKFLSARASSIFDLPGTLYFMLTRQKKELDIFAAS